MVNSSDKSLLTTQHHHHHNHHHDGDGGRGDEPRIQKGCIAIRVGKAAEEEEQQRFVIPVAYVNHPRFMQLLKEAEEEYGFDQEGPITIPCAVDCFLRCVQDIVDEDDKNKLRHGHHHGHHHHHHRHHIWCFG